VNLLEQRKEVEETELVEGARLNALHMYGVDAMSTKEILSYFDGYAPSWVEWINDSSCNVVFEEDAAAKRVMFQYSIPDAEGNIPPVSEHGVFRDTMPFKKPNGDMVPLQLRGATEADVRPDRPNPNSAWARSVQRKAKQENKPKPKRRQRPAVRKGDLGSGSLPSGPLLQGKRKKVDDAMAVDEPVEDRSKRRRKSAESDAHVAKQFAKDLRSILGNNSSRKAAKEAKAAAVEEGNVEMGGEGAVDAAALEAEVAELEAEVQEMENMEADATMEEA